MSTNIDAIREGTYAVKPDQKRIETDDTIWIKPKDYDQRSISKQLEEIRKDKKRDYKNLFGINVKKSFKEGEKAGFDMRHAKNLVNFTDDFAKAFDIKMKVSSVFRDEHKHPKGRKGSTHSTGNAIDVSRIKIDGKEMYWDGFAKDFPELYKAYTKGLRDRGYYYINEKIWGHGHFSYNPGKKGLIAKRISNPYYDPKDESSPKTIVVAEGNKLYSHEPEDMEEERDPSLRSKLKEISKTITY
jgi:hypothetical protein